MNAYDIGYAAYAAGQSIIMGGRDLAWRAGWKAAYAAERTLVRERVKCPRCTRTRKCSECQRMTLCDTRGIAI